MPPETSPERQAICNEALTWVGTPWAHMQRAKGAGVDCIQLIGAVGLARGYLTESQLKSVGYYSRQWHLHKNQEKLLNTLRAYGFSAIPAESRQPGDVLVFQYGRVVAHAGIYLGGQAVIHATLDYRRKVFVERLELPMLRRMKLAFVYPGLTPT